MQNDLEREKSKLSKIIDKLNNEIKENPFVNITDLKEKINKLEQDKKEILVKIETGEAFETDFKLILDRIDTLKAKMPSQSFIENIKIKEQALKRLKEQREVINEKINRLDVIDYHKKSIDTLTEIESKFREIIPLFDSLEHIYKKAIFLDGNSNGICKTLIQIRNDETYLQDKINQAIKTAPNQINTFERMKRSLNVGIDNIKKSPLVE